MSDEDRTGLASITDVEGGAVIKFTGPDSEAAGATAPRAASSNSTFVIGDPEGSPILRFLMNGHLNPSASRASPADSCVVRPPPAATRGLFDCLIHLKESGEVVPCSKLQPLHVD
jgi:hypothetical protein